jgi:glycine cleavage system H lipoate-binding protein
MIPHDLFATISAKQVEYLIAVVYLLLFIPFWRFINAEKIAERVSVTEAPTWLEQVVDWFLVPRDLHYAPGHAWARAESNLVTVGMDDFAQKLVGRTSGIRLPEVGSRLGQGEKGWTLFSDSKSIDMLSPVDGTVVAVNDRVMASKGTNDLDPYGEGWLFKVKPSRLNANLKHLLSGNLARRWMEEASEKLRMMMSPDLGQVYQDGGLPINGIARGLERERWDELCKSFFLT